MPFQATDYNNINDFIVDIARKQLTYLQISDLLQKYTGIHLSTNAIRKRLKRCGVPSRRGPTRHTVNDVKLLLQIYIEEHPITVGYRYMTDALRREGVHVRRDTVMKGLREVDSFGVDYRRRRRIKRRVYSSMGPNHVWHVDGYDKLKQFGFPIHGCIDGFSRRIMWLSVGPTNNDPWCVAQHYISCVQEMRGCPLIMQADPGTENVIIGSIQCTLRHFTSDCFARTASFRIVKSTFNQRIEAWWSMMRRNKIEWWIQFFKDMQSFGLFSKSNLTQLQEKLYAMVHRASSVIEGLQVRLQTSMECSIRFTEKKSTFYTDYLYKLATVASDWLGVINFVKEQLQFTIKTSDKCFRDDELKRYAFMPLLQSELDNIVDQWNSHFISRSKQASCPNGRPLLLFHLPTSTGAIDCIHPITEEDHRWLDSLKVPISRSGSEEFDDFARHVFVVKNWSNARDWKEALNQYDHLLELLM